jgi:hypothetical protein
VRTVAGRRHQPPPCDALLVVGAGVALVGAGAGGVVGGASRGVAGAVVGAAGWAAAADVWTVAGFRVGELVTCSRVAACRGGVAEAAGVAVGGVWTGAVWAGALRANTTAKPTVASAPSWVARQVSRPSRRTLTSRACPDVSSYLSRMSTDLTGSCVKRT